MNGEAYPVKVVDDTGLSLPEVVPPATTEKPPLHITESRGEAIPADPTQLYLRDIGRYALIDAQQEKELGTIVREGQRAAARLALYEAESNEAQREADLQLVEAGLQAKEAFVNANLRLVVSMAKRYANRIEHLNLLDLIQEGNIGLAHAVDKFEPERGFKFSTYATWWIKQAIERGINNKERLVRLPADEESKRSQLHRLQMRNADDDQILATMEISRQRLDELRRHDETALRLDAPIGEDADEVFANVIPDVRSNDGYELVEDAVTFAGGVGTTMFEILTTLEQDVLRVHYGLTDGQQKTYKEVQKHFPDFNVEQLRRIERIAIAKIREHYENRNDGDTELAS